MRDASGKPQWSPVVSFVSREVGNRWSDAVLDALRSSHPHAFDEVAQQE
jgi:hypothetical protein